MQGKNIRNANSVVWEFVFDDGIAMEREREKILEANSAMRRGVAVW